MKTKEIIGTIGTCVIVGAVSAAGAALWTNVLEGKIRRIAAKRRHSKSDKVIFINFKKAKRDLSR